MALLVGSKLSENKVLSTHGKRDMTLLHILVPSVSVESLTMRRGRGRRCGAFSPRYNVLTVILGMSWFWSCQFPRLIYRSQVRGEGSILVSKSILIPLISADLFSLYLSIGHPSHFAFVCRFQDEVCIGPYGPGFCPRCYFGTHLKT